jgi:uncharacterized membrane protein
VLRTVRSEDTGGGAFVPHASVTVAVALAIASLGVLIFYIHHVAASIQAPDVIAAVAGELRAVIDRLYPAQVGRPGAAHDARVHPPELPPRFAEDSAVVVACSSGYVQAVDDDAMMEAATAHDVVIEVCARPGRFVAGGVPLARVWPAQPCSDRRCKSSTQLRAGSRSRSATTPPPAPRRRGAGRRSGD